MRHFATFAFVLLGLFVTAHADAQVVIQGQVTYTDPNAGYQQGGGNYVQQGDPNAYQQPAYAQPAGYTQPVAQPQPVRYVHRSASIPAIFVPGIILLAGGYVAQAIGAPMLIDSWETSDQLGFAYIPILGPWLQLGGFEDVGGAFDQGIGYFSVITGLAQAVGLVLTIVGLTVREEWDEPVYALTDDPNGPTLAFDGAHATLSF